MRALAGAARRSPLLAAGLAMLLVVVAVGALAPWIAPYDPGDLVGDPFERPSAAHLLGTNDSGHDILSRLVWGTRTTVTVAVTASTLVLVMGVAFGLAAGLLGGAIDFAVMRVVDVMLALPVLPLLIFVGALAGPSLSTSILMIGLFLWPQTARIVRSQALSLRNRGFVGIARGLGGSPVYVVRRHLLPALGPVMAANLVFVAGLAVAIEAGLSFLGLADPAAVSWGAEMERALDSSQLQLESLWLWWLLPFGLALSFAIFGLSLVGVALEPRFNPREDRAR
ncbi:MAG TPA: ABC transporter permease [Acidimicrobiales bacterium]|jgi:peptide/nickel transport system permease protein|nr:ABC transporter permease [Acidimicrobiales bacterium]